MGDLDALIGSRISLISQQDFRYDGVLFSINAAESSIVLQNVRCNGTEDRVTDPTKQVPKNETVIPFVSFPGAEIKDLYVLDQQENAPPPAPAAAKAGPPAAPASKPQQQQAKPQQQQQQQQQNRPPPQPRPQQQPRSQTQPSSATAAASANATATPQTASQPRPAATPSTVGTGNHLMNLRVRTVTGTTVEASAAGGAEKLAADFDFATSLQGFNKTEVMANIESEGTTVTAAVKENKYKKDDFFDSLSCDALDKQEGRSTRLAPGAERALNQDTFGAIALQSNNYRHGGRGGGRGRGGQGGQGGGYRNRNRRGGRGGQGQGQGGQAVASS